MNHILSLGPADIHVWLAFYDDAAGERLHGDYRDLLDATERAREPRFHFARDRRRYLTTRALVRTVLSRYIPLDPTEWIFSTNAYGRPHVVNAEARAARLSFNISHTYGLIVLGVTRRRALGVDVEHVRARPVSMDIADTYFAPQEVAALTTAPPEQQQDWFFEYWTFKEAYIKARGMGLSVPLDKFSFHYPEQGAVAIAIHPELDDEAGRWEFWQFRPAPQYVAAICAERIDRQRPRVIARRVVPLLSETEYPLELLRVSDSSSNGTCHNQHGGVR